MEGAQASTLPQDFRRCPNIFARSFLLATRIFRNGNEAPSPAPPPPRFARFASSSGPPPPLRGGGKWRRSRDASHRESRNRLANDRTFSLFASFYSLFPISFSPFVISSLKTLRGRSADRRHCPVTAPRKAHVATCLGARGAGAPYGARSPTGAPPRHLRQRTNATAQLQPALPGTRRHRVLPASDLSPSPAGFPAVPVIVPDGRIRRSRPGAGYEAARGNRTRSVSGIVSRNALTRARFSPRLINNGRVSNKNVATHFGRRARAKLAYSCGFPKCANVRARNDVEPQHGPAGQIAH